MIADLSYGSSTKVAKGNQNSSFGCSKPDAIISQLTSSSAKIEMPYLEPCVVQDGRLPARNQ